MLQSGKLMRRILLVSVLYIAMIMSSCSGDGGEGGEGEVLQGQSVRSIAPSSIENESLKFSDGKPFHSSLADVPVTLIIESFNGTNAASFTLVSNRTGARARGLASWLNVYTLTVEDSTFPITNGTEEGPQVGAHIFVHLTDSTPVQVQQVADFNNRTVAGSPVTSSQTCRTVTSQSKNLDLLEVGQCLVVVGDLTVQELLTEIRSLPLQQSDQILQFLLTFPAPSPTFLGGEAKVTPDFDLNVTRSDNTQMVLQNCNTRTPLTESCSLIILSTDQVPSVDIAISSPFILTDSDDVIAGTGGYTLEIVSQKTSIDRNVCSNQSANPIVQDAEPNGLTINSIYTQQTPQTIGRTSNVGDCLPIRGRVGDFLGTTPQNLPQVDGFDVYKFTVVSGVQTVAFFLNSTRASFQQNGFLLFLRDGGQAATPLLQTCSTLAVQEGTVIGEVKLFPGAPVTCTVRVPPSGTLQVEVASTLVCNSRQGCRPPTGMADYSLDVQPINTTLSPFPQPDPTTNPNCLLGKLTAGC